MRSGRGPCGSFRAASTTTRFPRRSPIGSARPADLGAALAAAEIELVVYATDVSDYPEGDQDRDFELEYSSRTSRPRDDGPRDPGVGRDQRSRPAHRARRPDRDGWRLGAQLPVRACVSQPATSPISRPFATCRAIRRRSRRSSNVRVSASSASAPCHPCARSSSRSGSPRSGPRRGEPAHYGELIARLMRVAFARNAVVEERLAASARRRSPSCAPYERTSPARPSRRLRRGVVQALRAELDARFAAARFPFRHDRHVPTLIVRGTPGPHSLDPTFREREPAGRSSSSAR